VSDQGLLQQGDEGSLVAGRLGEAFGLGHEGAGAAPAPRRRASSK
jgi:hypothetical protein